VGCKKGVVRGERGREEAKNDLRQDPHVQEFIYTCFNRDRRARLIGYITITHRRGAPLVRAEAPANFFNLLISIPEQSKQIEYIKLLNFLHISKMTTGTEFEENKVPLRVFRNSSG